MLEIIIPVVGAIIFFFLIATYTGNKDGTNGGPVENIGMAIIMTIIGIGFLLLVCLVL